SAWRARRSCASPSTRTSPARRWSRASSRPRRSIRARWRSLTIATPRAPARFSRSSSSTATRSRTSPRGGRPPKPASGSGRQAMGEVSQARFPEDRDAVLDIYAEFVNSPRVSLDFQGNEQDYASLPGKYSPPKGAILLAGHEGQVVGGV